MLRLQDGTKEARIRLNAPDTGNFVVSDNRILSTTWGIKPGCEVDRSMS